MILSVIAAPSARQTVAWGYFKATPNWCNWTKLHLATLWVCLIGAINEFGEVALNLESWILTVESLKLPFQCQATRAFVDEAGHYSTVAGFRRCEFVLVVPNLDKKAYSWLVPTASYPCNGELRLCYRSLLNKDDQLICNMSHWA